MIDKAEFCGHTRGRQPGAEQFPSQANAHLHAVGLRRDTETPFESTEQLEAANLFIIPLDDERCWYRYHHLFADLLHRRLSQTQPDLLPALHRRASEWYEKNELIADGVGHALAANDVERAADLIERNALIMISHSELMTLLRWLNALPDGVVRSRPWLCVSYAWTLLYAGRLDAVEPRLQDAEKALGGFDDALGSAAYFGEMGLVVTASGLFTLRTYLGQTQPPVGE